MLSSLFILTTFCILSKPSVPERKLSIQSAQQVNSDEDDCRSGTPDQEILMYHVSKVQYDYYKPQTYLLTYPNCAHEAS